MAIVNGSFKWYQNGLGLIFTDPSILTTNTLKVILVSSGYTFNRTHQYYDVDITNELPTAQGYTIGGETIINPNFVTDGNGDKTFSSNNIAWTVTSGTLSARAWILYNDTPVNNKDLICFGHLNYNGGAPIDASSAISLGILLDSGGWFKYIAQDNP